MSLEISNENQFIRWNEEMAHKYDPEAYHLRSHFLIRWLERRRVSTILHFLQVKPEDTVLEVGCGAGNILEQVTSRRRYGIDLSTFLLEKCYKRLSVQQAELAQSNGERLPFAGERFQKLICSEVLEHVTNPRQVVAEMARVATSDSVIAISIPNEAWINRVKQIILKLGLGRWLLHGKDEAYHSPDRMTDEWHLHSFDLILLQTTVKDLLFIDKVKAIPFNWMPLRYVAICQLITNESITS